MRKDEEKRGDSSWAEGALSVFSVLKFNSRPIEEILLLPTAKIREKAIARVLKSAREKNIPVRASDEAFFDEVTTGHTHGGIIARVGDRKLTTPEDVFRRAKGFVFLLCGIEDPFNFGCAVRSFYAAGAGGMILTPRNWLSAAGVVIRSSAGASEALPAAVYDDVNSLAKTAHEYGYRIVLATEKAAIDLYHADLKKPVFMVVGGEKRGISADLIARADVRFRIPYDSAFSGSLTASAASAVSAFEVMRTNRVGKN